MKNRSAYSTGKGLPGVVADFDLVRAAEAGSWGRKGSRWSFEEREGFRGGGKEQQGA